MALSPPGLTLAFWSPGRAIILHGIKEMNVVSKTQDNTVSQALLEFITTILTR
jgi:hypothetical protein